MLPETLTKDNNLVEVGSRMSDFGFNLLSYIIPKSNFRNPNQRTVSNIRFLILERETGVMPR
jgi:hypothetical protein